ncbi:MAG: hypothetical protein KIT22_15140 [Verrucomicrobiae bacterium]|nr:hypothetical protein [Verrucomicrobiae bacterium]
MRSRYAAAAAMRGLLAVGSDGAQPLPIHNIEESLKRQKEGLEGVTDIRLREIRPTDSEAETRLVYDLLRPDGEVRQDWPTQLEVQLQNQGGEWKMVHTGWHADPMVVTATSPASGEPNVVRRGVTQPPPAGTPTP